MAATINDLDLELGGRLNRAECEEFALLLEDAAGRVQDRGIFTAEEAAGWTVFEDLTVMFRGDEPTATEPVAELGRTLAALLRGPLCPPPEGTMWLYGWPGGRITLPMRYLADEG